ncbi:hypothetical protein [Roseibium alexandrii]|uniref:DUF5648 domain-containing protein n=1 Tax=Roseibium alexandrii TaxID=388408 RepID=A0A0M7AQU8_9HYPH|nr:hypothetical protein [Roseibium alexandrii]CTQ75954.1 hypothetical protein LAX5112_04422 [Roseibium alexandrii]
MAVTVTINNAKNIGLDFVIGTLDSILTDNPPAFFSSELITYSAETTSYDGIAIDVVTRGTNFTRELIDGTFFQTGGRINSVVVSSNNEELFTILPALEFSDIASIYIADETGVHPTGLEEYFMALPWVVTLSNQNDSAVEGMLVGDNANFNLTNNDLVLALAGDDRFFGGDGHDTFNGGSGDDWFDGGTGVDRAAFIGTRSDYAVFRANDGDIYVADSIGQRDDTDVLTNTEHLVFDERTVSLDEALIEPTDPDNSAYQIYRFYNTESGSHFFTTSIAERNSIIENLNGLSYEGNAFDSNVTDVNGTAVFRFYNTTNGVHFYTADAGEAASIRQNMSNLQDEGIAYYASADDSNGGTALFRFFNTQNGSHFFTLSEAERDNIVATLGHYSYEGIAFYVDLA